MAEDETTSAIGDGGSTDASGAPLSPPASAEAFFDVDIRVGEVVAVEEFAAARKPAWKLQVNFGAAGTRWTSAQVTNYTREELLGRRVIGVVNIGTRRIAGFTSEFLILGAMSEVGVQLLAPDAHARVGDRVG